jgi:hypothetical protein
MCLQVQCSTIVARCAESPQRVYWSLPGTFTSEIWTGSLKLVIPRYYITLLLHRAPFNIQFSHLLSDNNRLTLSGPNIIALMVLLCSIIWYFFFFFEKIFSKIPSIESYCSRSSGRSSILGPRYYHFSAL